MKRELLSKKELLRWMNSQLAKYEDCVDCCFNDVNELSEVDKGGCNWDDPYFNCSGVPIQLCLTTANKIVAKAKDKYNVIW